MSASAGFCGLAILLAVALSPSVADAGVISAHGGQATQVAADGARRSSMAFMAPAVGPLGSSQASTGLRSVCPTARLPLPAAPTRKHSGVATLVAQYRGRGGRGRGRGMRQMPVAPKGPPMDNDIQFSEMRVVVANPDGKDEMLGVMTKEEALAAADERVRDALVYRPCHTPHALCRRASLPIPPSLTHRLSLRAGRQPRSYEPRRCPSRMSPLNPRPSMPEIHPRSPPSLLPPGLLALQFFAHYSLSFLVMIVNLSSLGRV